MFLKLEKIGFKSLNILTNNFFKLNISILNKKAKRYLPQSQFYHNRYEKNNHQNERKVFNQTNCLLITTFSIIYLDKKCDFFRNYLNQFTVKAKISGQEEVVFDDELKSTVKNISNIRKSYNFLADAAEKAIPSVVQIEVFEEDPYFGDLIKVSCGSGFIVSKSTVDSTSLVLTNSHVVLDHDKVIVLLHNGKKLTGKVECIDNFTDLAFVKIADASSPILEFESSKDIRVGEFVVAIGSPLGLGNSVTAGIVSSTTRRGKEIGLENDDMEYIQTDASVNLGNSGGPLISIDGKVVGINTFRVRSGINLAIPSDYAIKFLDIVNKESKTLKSEKQKIDKKRFFGITMLSLTPETLNQLKERFNFNDVTYGVLLVNVARNSIADKAGLKTGDIIIEINHKKTSEASEIYKTIEENSRLTLLIIRGGQKIRFNVSFE